MRPTHNQTRKTNMYGLAKFFLVVALIFISASTCLASATNVYIAQNSAGAASGADCANALPVSSFNNAANWGGSSNQIGPGTTVHLCGTFTGTPGSTMLTVQGSGTSGNPITIKFEIGASLQSPYWGVGGAVNLNSQSWIVVDGGVPCGTTAHAVDQAAACNGIIENTLNGASYESPVPTCPGGPCSNNQSSQLIHMPGATNIEIKNMGLEYVYVHVAEDRSCGAPYIGASNVKAIDWGGATTVSIHDSYILEGGWVLSGSALGTVQVYNNKLYHTAHGMAFGGNGSNAYGPIYIHDNHFGEMGNWGTGSGFCDHQDGVHFWAGQGNSSTISGLYLYDNTFDGNPSDTPPLPVGTQAGCTAGIYEETAVSNVYIFNNLINWPNTASCFAAFQFSGGSNDWAWNNTSIAAGTTSGTNFRQNGDNASFMNNVLNGQNTVMYWVKGSAAQTSSGTGYGWLTNVYTNVGTNTFSYLGSNTNSLSTWQGDLGAGTGQDAGSQLLAQNALGLDSNGHPLAGSPVIGAGTNLTSLCTGALVSLCTDHAGNPRPTIGNWDIGAYQSGAVSSRPMPPTGLTAVVQ